MAEQDEQGGMQAVELPVRPGDVQAPDLPTGDDLPTEHPGLTATREIGAGAKPSDRQIEDALDWFLEADDAVDQAALYTETLKINVGGQTEATERWVYWRIRTLEPDEMEAINRLSRGNRRDARAGREPSARKTNELVVAEATVEPDLREVVRTKRLSERDMRGSMVIVLRNRFVRKPGLIDQIAARVMAISGYEESDIEAIEAGKD